MNRTPLRRWLALAAGVALGTAGALALPTPASAHHTTVTGAAECITETGEWEITWTVANSEDDIPGTVTSVVADPDTPVSGIEFGATLPADGTLTGTQVVPGATVSASLTVTVEWTRTWMHRGKPYPKVITDSDTGTVPLEGTCEQPPPPTEPPPPTPTAEPPPPPPATEPPATEPPATESPAPPESPSAPESPAPGGGGGLPVTGASTGIVAGIALLLAVIGTAMFLVARRRRIRFTA